MSAQEREALTDLLADHEAVGAGVARHWACGPECPWAYYAVAKSPQARIRAAMAAHRAHLADVLLAAGWTRPLADGAES